MRAALAGEKADQFYRTVTFVAWGLAAVFLSFVALPLASSSPYPTSARQEWAVHRVPAPKAVAKAEPHVTVAAESHDAQAAPAGFSLASASSVPVPSGPVVALVNTVRTLSIRRPIGDDQEPERRIVTASLGPAPVRETPYELRPPAAPSLPDDVVASAPAEHPTVARPRSAGTMDEVDQYLWSVYQRAPIKRDRSGDFSWKDPAAAVHAGMTLQAYVIMGMDRDLREVMYHAGKAMDAAGIQWTIVSAFRDDYRQSIAAGLKARTGYSRHGGSKATGGYGHGLAVDVGHADGDSHNRVFAWIDANGAKYGIARPIRNFDPPHVEPRGDWRRIAANLRKDRTGAAVAEITRDDATPLRTRTAQARVASAGRSVRGRRHR